MHLVALAIAGLLSASDPAPASVGAPTFSLPALRHQLHTKIFWPTHRQPAPRPPAGVLERVEYAAPLGKNVAYVTPVRPGPRRPAMLWIAGGFDWGIDPGSWLPSERDNDQSAQTFRQAGLVLMRPALRGSNRNPGRNECFLGEVDDVLAAADFLARRPDVDPARIYLGGHSTGGTLALLVAESTARFRAVFALGPVADPRQYGKFGCMPAHPPEDEAKLRSPAAFLREIRTPTFIIEGEGGNAQAFPLLEARKGDAPIRFLLVPDATHFTVIAPASEAISAAIDAARDGLPALDVAAISARLQAP